MTNLEPENSISSQKERRQKIILENFKTMFFKFANPLRPEHKSAVEQFLEVEILPNIGTTPDHLPYPLIIEGVLRKLNKQCSKETISQSIKEEYPRLPWAHETLLEHHLDVLRENGSIIQTSNGLYYILGQHEEVVKPRTLH